ncbi:MAG: type II toxin-antitoxin system VapC family toxin [Bacillota bacterium]|nr:type II toxin-antitoxin system VapC family toxin [Bacillota bacterium]
MRRVLDAYAVLAFLGGEPGADLVAEVLGKGTALISSVNLGEVYCILLRERGRAEAELAEAQFLETANLELAEADWPRVRAAAEIKADGGLSYADCFALALASEAGAPLLTADPEIVRAAERRGVAVMWPGLSGAPEGCCGRG